MIIKLLAYNYQGYFKCSTIHTHAHAHKDDQKFGTKVEALLPKWSKQNKL